MTRPLYWSVRREVWENRSIYFAPAAVATFVFFGFLVSSFGLPQRRRALLMGDPAKAHAAIAMPYDFAATFLIFAIWIVGAWYCIDALHGERRDRSILFWKSLPVSDYTTVLSKVAVPLLILPPIAFVLVITTQLMIALWTSLLLLSSGMSPLSTFVYVNFIQDAFILIYALIALALWHAPLYAWLLLVSAWAKRATLLWVVLPPAAIMMFERIAFSSTNFAKWLKWRLIGGMARAFIFKPQVAIDSLSQLTPIDFITTPGLWLGLLFAVACIVTAARTRRYREPM